MASSPTSLSDLQFIKGVGPRRMEALEAAGIHSIRDLLYVLPRTYYDKRRIIPIKEVRNVVDAGDYVTVVGQVTKLEARRTKTGNRIILIMTVSDGTGTLPCMWFQGYRFMKDLFQEGETLALSAVPARDKRTGRPVFTHPDFDRLSGGEDDEPDWGKMFNTGAIIPRYRESEDLGKVGLDSRGFRRIIRNALPSIKKSVPETLDGDIAGREGLLGLHEAIQHIHFPPTPEALEQATRRLKFDELFFLQLMVHLRREARQAEPGFAFAGESERAQKLRGQLPFKLTSAQEKVLKEIEADQRHPRPMNRLLQGDVGSGKTVVALMACLRTIDHGAQVAFMAPTEVLADQHFRTLQAMTAGLDVNVRSLTGGQKKALREDVLEDIRRGSANIIVGTHALLEEPVAFHRLGLVVIDEQHRFGVRQRAGLREKGVSPDLLIMTATPIPRTLAMTLYGDLDVSTIDMLPANRKPVVTAVRTEDQRGRVEEFIRKEVGRGRQAYVVFPLIEESEKVVLKAATKEVEHLRKVVYPGLEVGLLHGRLKSEEKDAVMRAFKEGKTHILVSTTVIEVGIDVPNATVMVIENSERFGLSQLHQLRGRVGRGADQSYCILMSNSSLFQRSLAGMEASERRDEELKATRRLKTMVDTTDGFVIAEVDLELRGPGELFGTRQSGAPLLSIANLVHDRDLLERARERSAEIVGHDPHLRHPEHRMIRRHFEDHYRDLFFLGSIS